MKESVSNLQRALAVGAHVSYFLGGVGFVIAPLVIMLIGYKDGFVHSHAKQAFLCHLLMLFMALAIFAAMLLGSVIWKPVALLAYFFGAALSAAEVYFLVITIIAAINAWRGNLYSYPLISRL